MTSCSATSKLSDVMVDFFIEVIPNDGNLPPSFVSPTPADGSSIVGYQGQTVTFSISATDVNGDSISLQGAWSTPGMTFTGTTTGVAAVNAGFAWAIPSNQGIGASQACFTAKDPKYASPQRCITIKVGYMTVQSVTPTQSWADGGVTATVRGQNFGGGTNYACRFFPPQTNLAAIDVAATFISITEIRCTIPNVRSNPGVYKLEVSKDGNAFTDDRQTINLVASCPPSVTNMCNGHGTCNAGICQCTGSWKGTDCSALCGNSVIEAGESCDDGNTNNGDGCNSSCQPEGGWSCNGASPTVCQRCGDGVIQGTETCDDSNTASGDGCSSTVYLFFV